MSEQFRESAVVFECNGDQLVGVVAAPRAPQSVGVIIIVGGPQYRAGSHRQFTLLARRMAEAGFTVLRFDYRGMGDSSGGARTFEHVESDIRAAIDTLIAACPTVRTVALWGLCDAASAAIMYAPTDARVAALVLANPWARGEETYARTQLKHYYLRRVLSTDFWRKVFSGRFDLPQAGGDLRENISRATAAAGTENYRVRMMRAMKEFKGRTLLVLATHDLTGQEFQHYVASRSEYRERWERSNVQRKEVAGADHTFSRAPWQRQLEELSAEWLESLSRAD